MKPEYRKAVVAAASAGLVLAAAVGGAPDASAAPAAATSPPLTRVTIAKAGLTIAGARTVHPGRLAISLHAAKNVDDQAELQLIAFKKGYSFAKFRADLKAFGASEGPMGASPAGLKHLRHAIKETVLFGGVEASAGRTSRMTVTLSKPGHYYVYNDTGELPAQPRVITVRGRFVHHTAPKVKAVVTATSTTRFGGSTVLPAHGVITFKNRSTKSPHLLALLHVKKGTTRQQIIDYFNSGVEAPPPFLLSGSAGTDALGVGRSQTITLSLPAGTYAELCFFPDPVTGMPHAFMGMVRIVTLK